MRYAAILLNTKRQPSLSHMLGLHGHRIIPRLAHPVGTTKYVTRDTRYRYLTIQTMSVAYSGVNSLPSSTGMRRVGLSDATACPARWLWLVLSVGSIMMLTEIELQSNYVRIQRARVICNTVYTGSSESS